jgi:hypothetical protein
MAAKKQVTARARVQDKTLIGKLRSKKRTVLALAIGGGRW